jgi:predicted metal-binding protein
MDIEEDLRRFCQLAVQFGASEAKPIKAEGIVVSDWVRLKCQYGCDSYGKSLTCPPYSPTPEQFRKVLKCYHWAILLKFEPKGPEQDRNNRRTDRKNRHGIVTRLEREIFLSGYHSAFGLVAGPCSYCEECNLKECVNPDLARPSMESCGIDVFSTVRKADFNLNVLKSRDEKPTYFSLLLIQ